MIRHHVAQDLLSAEAAPLYLGAGMPASAQAALLSGTVETHSRSEAPHAAAPPHPFAYYASPLSTMILLVISIIALSALIKPLREAIALRRVRPRDRHFISGAIAASLAHPLRLPATFSIEQNKPRQVSTLPVAV